MNVSLEICGLVIVSFFLFSGFRLVSLENVCVSKKLTMRMVAGLARPVRLGHKAKRV